MLRLAHIHIHALTHTHTHTHITHTHTHFDVLAIVIIPIFAFQPSVDLGLSFSNEYVLLQRGTPGQIFQKCVFWLPISNEGSRRCSEVFVFEIFAFKVFNFISWRLRNSQLLDDVRNVILSACGVDKQWHVYILRTDIPKMFYLLTACCIQDGKDKKMCLRLCVLVYVVVWSSMCIKYCQCCRLPCV